MHNLEKVLVKGSPSKNFNIRQKTEERELLLISLRFLVTVRYLLKMMSTHACINEYISWTEIQIEKVEERFVY